MERHSYTVNSADVCTNLNDCEIRSADSTDPSSFMPQLSNSSHCFLSSVSMETMCSRRISETTLGPHNGNCTLLISMIKAVHLCQYGLETSTILIVPYRHWFSQD